MAIPEAGWHSFLPEIRVGFHCSRKKFNKFSLSYFGQSDAGQWGEGIYFSDKEEIASQWGNYCYRCNLHFYSPFIIESGDMNKLNDFLDLGATTKECTDKLKELGYDSIISEGETWYIDGKTMEGNQYVIFDPENIDILDITNLDEGKKMNEAFETHNKLNPRLFNNNTKKMRGEVRERLIEIADKFVDNLKEDGVPLKVYDYWVLGSNAAYNYTPKSDIDTHIIVNMEDVDVAPEVLTILYNYAKSKFNDDYDITIRGQEVELYIEDINTSAISNGVYSLKRDIWIKEPEPMEESSIDITDEDEYKEWELKFNNAIESGDIEKLQSFVDDIYILRKDSLAKDGEFGLGNLIFKEMRNQDKLQQIKDKIKELESKELTLEALKESVSYHSTKTIEDAKNIITNGFKGDSICLSADLYDSQGYGQHTIEVSDLDSLNLYLVPKNEMDKLPEVIQRIKKEGIYDGIKYRYSDDHPYNYEIYKLDNLNRLGRKLLESLKESNHIERTVYNAWQAWSQYKQKYGRVDSFFELQHNFHLTNDEMKWVLDRAIKYNLIDEYTKNYVIDYLKLNESLSKPKKPSNNAIKYKNFSIDSLILNESNSKSKTTKYFILNENGIMVGNKTREKIEEELGIKSDSVENCKKIIDCTIKSR